MQALRRVSIKARFPSLSPTTVIKNNFTTSSNQCLNQEQYNNTITKDEETTSELNIKNTLFAAGAAASLTPAGYAISPVGVTVLSNLPLAAFAFVQISGLSPIRQILKEKKTGDLSPFPFVSLYTNCAVWSLYGILQSDQTIIIANLAGTIAGVVYTAMFAKYTHLNMMKFYAPSGAILATFLSTPFWSQQMMGVEAAQVLGTFGMTTAVILMASPLAVVGTVIKQKSTAALPFPVSLAMTINGACWGSYGWFVTNDMYVWLPNVLGFGAGLIQLSLFAIY